MSIDAVYFCNVINNLVSPSDKARSVILVHPFPLVTVGGIPKKKFFF